jgi:hypothetical protein
MNEFDILIEAVKQKRDATTIIDGFTVSVIPNPFSNNGLYSLFINRFQSNSCLSPAMKKLLTEWKDGKRHVLPIDFAHEGAAMLYKKH